MPHRPHDPTPAELETLLGPGAVRRWNALPPADRDRIAADLEALQRTAREIAHATRQLDAGLAELDAGGDAPPPADRPEEA